jgi:hypothetical protein
MPSTRSPLASLALSIAVISLAGCSAPDRPVESAAAEEAAPPPVVSTPTPIAPTGQVFASEVSMSDPDGYTFSVAFEIVVGDPEISIVNDKPGEGSVIVPVDGVIVVTNTTPGRTFTGLAGQATDFTAFAFYPLGTPICLEGVSGTNPRLHALDVKYCSVYLAGGQQFLPQSLESGQSSKNIGLNLDGGTRLSAVPEASLEAVAAQLAEPPAYFAVVTNDRVRYPCNFNNDEIIASIPAMPGCT